jgi:hypothetical protein
MFKIYRNLTRKMWSVKSNFSGKEKVTGYAQEGFLYGNVTFRVSESGRQRVIREGKKYVHAYVSAKTLDQSADPRNNPETCWIRVSYNPKKNITFIHLDTGEAIQTAAAVYLTATGQVWATFE